MSLIAPGGAYLPPRPSTSVEIYLYDLWHAMAQGVDVSLYAKETVLRSKQRQKQKTRLLGAYGEHFLPVVMRDCVLHDRQLSVRMKHIIQIDNRPKYLQKVKTTLPKAHIVLSLHSLTFLEPQRISFDKALEALTFADRIVVNSEYIKSELHERFAVATSQISVIHPGVDTKLFHPLHSISEARERERVRRSLHVKGKEMVALFVGRVISRKGVDVAIRALSLARERYGAKVVLWIVGSTPKGADGYIQQLRRLARGLPVSFLGYKSRNELAVLFRASDILLCPSQKAEAFGLVNLEAQASGLPVIASGAWGIKESLVPNVTGILVKDYKNPKSFAKQLSKLASEQAVREGMGQAGRMHAETHCTWRHTAANYVELYERL